MNTTKRRAAVIVCTSTLTMLLGACGPQRAAEIAHDDQLLVLEEIGLASSMLGYEEPAQFETGPSLIAGDWLAIQCAQASGFMDMFEWTPDESMPVYASVISSDFE
ncbi:MAG: hypothetical protein AB8C13_00575 [Phycisphaerales bacterium]